VGCKILRERDLTVVEISALRMTEWEPLIHALDDLDLSVFHYVSIHLPSKMNADEERSVVLDLQRLQDCKFPLILHPDAIVDFSRWREFGILVCVENMDKRKPLGAPKGSWT